MQNFRKKKGMVEIIRYAAHSNSKPLSYRLTIIHNGKEIHHLPESSGMNPDLLEREILGKVAESASSRILLARCALLQEGLVIDFDGEPDHLLFVTNRSELCAYAGSHNYDIVKMPDGWNIVIIPAGQARKYLA